jgi:hypothetical protein
MAVGTEVFLIWIDLVPTLNVSTEIDTKLTVVDFAEAITLLSNDDKVDPVTTTHFADHTTTTEVPDDLKDTTVTSALCTVISAERRISFRISTIAELSVDL